MAASSSITKIGGIARYYHEQLRNIPRYSKGKFDVHRIIVGSNSPSYLSGNRLDQFRILHNLTEYALMPEKKQEMIRINTANEFQILLYPELSSKPKTSEQKKEYPKRRKGLEAILDADFIIANSTQTKLEAKSLGFDPKRIFVANLGIDHRFAFDSKSRKANKKFVIGHVGAIRRRKNIEFSFDTMSKLSSDDYEFNLYGRIFPDFEIQLRKSLAKSPGKSFYIGIAPEKRIVEIYDSFDAFIMPSWYEGFGLEIIEAQARGIPVIICKGSRIPEETRRYCITAEDPEHAAQIVEGIRSDGYDERMRDKALKYARSFTWENTAKKTVDAYVHALG